MTKLDHVRRRLYYAFSTRAGTAEISAYDYWHIAQALGWEVPTAIATAAHNWET